MASPWDLTYAQFPQALEAWLYGPRSLQGKTREWFINEVRRWPDGTTLLDMGCGGGVRFLHTMCGILCGMLGQDQAVRADQIEHLCQMIWHMPIDVMVRHYGIDNERAEIIVPGAVVLATLIKRLKVVEIRPARRSVRDGLLADFLKQSP